jgi:hypothetical protein
MEVFGIYSAKNLEIVDDAADALGRTMTEVVHAVAMASEGNIRGLRQYAINQMDITRELGHAMKTDTIEGLEEIGDAVMRIFGQRYAGAGKAEDRSLNGMVNTLRNNWIAFKKEVADAGVFETAKTIIGTILQGVHVLTEGDEGRKLAQIVGETIRDAMLNATKAMLAVALNLSRLYDGIASLVDRIKDSGIFRFLPMGPGVGPTPPGFAAGQNPGEDASWFSRFWYQLSGGKSRDLGAAVYSGLSQQSAGPRNVRESAIMQMMAAIDAAMQSQYAPGATDVPGPPAGWGAVPSVGAAAARAHKDSYKYPGYPYASSIQKWMQKVGMGGQVEGIYGPTATDEQMREAAEAQLDYEDEINERRKAQTERITAELAHYWSSYYGSLGRMSEMLLSGDEKKWKKMRQIAWMGLRDMLADYIEVELKKAAIGRLQAIADMLREGATWNWASAAKSAAAALAYGAVSAFAGSLLRGGAGDMPAVEEGGGAAGYDSGNNSSSTSRTAGVKAQSVTYNLYVIHNAPAIYGSSDGITELFEREFLPRLISFQEAYA